MNREQMIREARTIEAMRRGYMGMEGKISVIAKRLGQPIIQQGSRSFEQTFLSDPFALEKDDEMPTIGENDHSYEIGLHYDGLSRGINLSVYVHFHHREIICEFNGQKVYWEIGGELESYVPHESWENQLEKIYDNAKKVERLQRPQERKKLVEAANKKRQELLNEFKQKWGLT
jgi:hypothetical protein